MTTYRVCAKYRQWVGKPDPTNMGNFEVSSDDPSWIQSKAQELHLKGHRVLRIQKNVNGKWVTI